MQNRVSTAERFGLLPHYCLRREQSTDGDVAPEEHADPVLLDDGAADLDRYLHRFGIPYKTFFTSIAKGYYFHPGTTQVRKSFGFVGNTVFQLQRLGLAADACVHGRTFYLADYDPIDVREMAELIQTMMEVRKIKTVPVSALRAAAVVGDLAKKLGWKAPPLTSFRLDNLLTNMVYDLEPLREVAGPLPYSLQEGVKKTIEWMRKEGSSD